MKRVSACARAIGMDNKIYPHIYDLLLVDHGFDVS